VTRVSLHQHSHHPIFRSPAADVVIEGDGIFILLFRFVAWTAWNKNENGSILSATIGRENIDDVLVNQDRRKRRAQWLFPDIRVSRQCDVILRH